MIETPDTPTHIGRYRVEQRLARGGMGEVYRGYDTQLERPVALKRILPAEAKDETAVRRFRREARAAARLGHSTIVQLFDWLEEAGSHWIVMEWIAGPTLREVLRRGPLPWPTAARIGCDIAHGLAVAHDIGIVHRDLKTTNIMITAHDELRIMDFGLAKQVAASEQTPLSAVSEQGIVIGTVSAMSPEQAQGRPVDNRSDLFSLGSLLYELFTGTKAFRDESSVKVLLRVCTFDPPPVSAHVADIPDALSALVAHLLQKDPRQRPADARDVAAQLEPFAAPRSAMHGLARMSVQTGTKTGKPGARANSARTTPTAVTRLGVGNMAGAARSAVHEPSLHDGPMTADYGDSAEYDPRLEVTAGLGMAGNEWTRPTRARMPADGASPPDTDSSGDRSGDVSDNAPDDDAAGE